MRATVGLQRGVEVTRIRFLIVGVLLTGVLAGCSRAPAVGVSSLTVSPATGLVTSAPQPLPADGIATLRLKGYVAVDSTETSKLSAAAAVHKVSWPSVEGTTTILTVSKARLTGPGVQNRLVWVIGVAPVTWVSHGIVTGTGSALRAAGSAARGAFVIDANTGEEGPIVIGPTR